MLKLSQHDARHAMNMWEKWQKEAEDLKSLNKELAVALENLIRVIDAQQDYPGKINREASPACRKAEAAIKKARGE